MPHPFQWTIAQPCPEPVEKMPLTQLGRYCASCSRQIYDLDRLSPQEAPPGICGYLRTPGYTAAVKRKPLQRWISRLMVPLLVMVPFKKARSHALSTGAGVLPGMHKKQGAVKRITGQVRDKNNRPVRTLVQLHDTQGVLLAQTMSLANGSYRMMVDTPAVDTPQVVLTAIDTPTYRAVIDSVIIGRYHKDEIFIRPDVIVTAGVPPLYIVTRVNVDLRLAPFSQLMYAKAGDAVSALAAGAVEKH